MRKGFTLIEVLVIVIIMPFIFLIFDGLFRTLLSDIPWSWRIAQENTTMLSMLDQLQQDIDAAKGLPESFGTYTANDNLLLIESPDGVLCYQLKDGKVTRSSSRKCPCIAQVQLAFMFVSFISVWCVMTLSGQ